MLNLEIQLTILSKSAKHGGAEASFRVHVLKWRRRVQTKDQDPQTKFTLLQDLGHET